MDRLLPKEVPKLVWKHWYDYIAKYKLQTMNYGYSIRNNKLADENETSLMLYEKVSNLHNLQLQNGSMILEVGCGRGGGLFHLAQKYPMYNFIGIDFSGKAIEHATNEFKLHNLKYMVGNAHALPFDNASVSLVINIESSHCYPDFSKFLSETKRVLIPDGYFCYADFRNSFYEIQEYFGIMFMKDITPQVLNSMKSMRSIRKKQIQYEFNRGNIIDKIVLHNVAKEFVGGNDSRIYNEFKYGVSIYFHIQAKNNKQFVRHTNIFSTEDIRNIGRQTIPIKEFISKIDRVCDIYKKLEPSKPMEIIQTKRKYTKQLLKTLSNNYTKPVLFKQCGIYVDKFDLDGDVQIVENEKIKRIKSTEINEKTSVFNQMIDANQFTNLNSIFGEERLFYDCFQTPAGNVTGLHNEMNSTINFQTAGRKCWKLIDPKYSDLLLPMSSQKDSNQYVSLNCDWYDIDVHNKLPVHKVILEKGDMLFVPSWWWHQPTSITNCKSISIRTVHGETFNHPLFMPELIYKYIGSLKQFIDLSEPTDNRYLNAARRIHIDYLEKGVDFNVF
jgi:ubiquinone/menaquinone biosynthesis C-methylase UbiE